MSSSTESTGKVLVYPHAKILLSGETENGESVVNSESILNGKAGQKLNMKEWTHMTETNDQHIKSMNDDHMENGLGITIERNWVRPDLPSRCTWKLGGPTTESPHNHLQK